MRHARRKPARRPPRTPESKRVSSIRKITIDQLQPGMYVVDLHRRWLDHNIWRRRFMVRDAAHVDTLRREGIQEISIDIEKGDDIPSPRLLHPPMPPRAPSPVRSLADHFRAIGPKVTVGEERRRAARLLSDATIVVTDMMYCAQAGGEVDAALLEPLVQRMMSSVQRNPDALVPLARLKQMDSYANEHAVATAALIIALGHQQGLPEPEIEKLALGTMVKDIGHAALDAKLVDKPGALSLQEFSVVQSHVEEGLAVLEATSRLPDAAVSVVLEHHERYNGLGYPYRMAGDEITLGGRMAAIVDTYDAMTSDRPYRPALSPALALRQLYAQGGSDFDPMLVASFVKTVGVYPVGTLVLLESGHLAVVDEINHEHLLSPIVRVIYHAGRSQYVTPQVVDLSRKVGNHYGQIVRAETIERWGLSAVRWQPV